MQGLPFFLCLAFALASVCAPARSDVALRTGDLEVTREELEAVIATTPDSLLRTVANNDGDLFEYLNSLAVTRQIAAKADALSKDDPAYWELHFALVNAKRIFMMRRMIDEMSPSSEAIIELARERYASEKDKYALIPEKRASSHILFASEVGEDRRALRKHAQSVLDDLRAGADWEQMVQEHSDDSSSAARGGRIKAIVEFGSMRVTPSYVAALHEIETVGEYSEITDSPFGIHIIRLDEIIPKAYKRFDEVAGDIISDLENEFRAAASKEIRARYTLTPDKAYINDAIVDELLQPYRESSGTK